MNLYEDKLERNNSMLKELVDKDDRILKLTKQVQKLKETEIEIRSQTPHVGAQYNSVDRSGVRYGVQS